MAIEKWKDRILEDSSGNLELWCISIAGKRAENDINLEVVMGKLTMNGISIAMFDYRSVTMTTMTTMNIVWCFISGKNGNSSVIIRTLVLCLDFLNWSIGSAATI